ncbi:hypothetical protein SDC9_112719 [bioreactor metagenome]|uniref:NAD-specific glutamate dehydrogenase n=1 Tax=bioreactor metagenome TaxID=1076179 RepID=A0A645BKI0_9ZZZZ
MTCARFLVVQIPAASGHLAARLIDGQERLAAAHYVGVVVLVLHLGLGLALEEVVVLEHLVVGLADFFFAGQALVLHALHGGDDGLLVNGAGLDDGVDHQLGADVRTGQAVVGVELELVVGALDEVEVQWCVHGVPILCTEVDAVAQVGAERFELLQARCPGDQDGHVLVHAEAHRLAQGVGRLLAEVQDQQHIGLGGDGVGEVTAEFLFGQRVVAVAHMLDALFLEDVLGCVEQAVAEHILRRDGVHALGFGVCCQKRAHGLLDRTECGHGPAEGCTVAVLAGDLVRTCGGDEDATGLLGLLAHGERFGRQDAAREEFRSLLRCVLHLADGRGGLAFGIEQRVAQRAIQRLAVLLDGQLHAQIRKLAIGRKRTRHRHGAAELNGVLGLRECAAVHESKRCRQCAECRELQEVATLHVGLQVESRPGWPALL